MQHYARKLYAISVYVPVCPSIHHKPVVCQDGST